MENITPCVIVLPKHAQSVIISLKQNGLLNNDFKVTNTGKAINIPINNLDKAKKLLEQLEVPYSVQLMEVEPKETKPHSIKEILIEQIPNKLIEYIPTSFDIIGTIAIVELKDEIRFCATEIGMAIMVIHPNISCVYEKTGAVSGLYRTRELVCIAGKDDPLTIHKEYGLQIVVDVKNTYFSPRLSTEHNRVATMVQENEKVLDMFCGVGSFPLHIAKRISSHVVAVDLNPHAIACLKQSISKNKLVGKIEPLQADAKTLSFNPNSVDRIIMNHPSQAMNYLEHAIHFLKRSGKIHFYCFAPIKDTEDFITHKLKEADINLHVKKVTVVRQYSPTENHVCADLVYP